MLTLSPQLRIYVHAGATDMRKSFDGLSGLVRSVFRAEPLDGSLFLFLNRRRDRVKILYWDRDGLALWCKKLDSHAPHSFLFTEIGKDANTRAVRPATVGGMDSSSTRTGPRR